MAIKNTTSKKTVTKVVTKESAEIKQPEKKTYAPNDEIMTTSCTAGELIMIGRKTGRYYSWANYGDKTPVEYQDLKAEQYISGSQYIYNPLFLIDDEEFLSLPENKKVANVYEHILNADDIEKIFSLDNISFEKTVEKLPKGIKNSLKSIAAERIQNGSLDSITKIKALDRILGTDFFNCDFAS